MPFQVIYKTFWGAYIDFDNLISIGAPGLFGMHSDVVGFSMFFKDAVEPLQYSREIEICTEKLWVYPPVDRNRSIVPPDVLKLCPENGAIFLRLWRADGSWESSSTCQIINLNAIFLP